MAAPKGNKFWECRSSHGPNPKFDNPDDLWAACVEYFQWVEDHPLQEGKLVQSEGKPVLESLPKMRAMTITGLCLFLGVSRGTWNHWRENRDDLSEIISIIDDAISTQKFEGASAGLLNANIIARDLGLSEKTEAKVEAKHDVDSATEALAALLSARSSRK